jgi:hypothetical protein
MSAPLTNCRVVLVRPEVAANVGSVARVMRNFGLRELVLVAPKADPADRVVVQFDVFRPVFAEELGPNCTTTIPDR